MAPAASNRRIQFQPVTARELSRYHDRSPEEAREAQQKAAEANGIDPTRPPRFKVLGGGSRLVPATMEANGLRPAGGRSTAPFEVLWSSVHLKGHFFQGLARHQRINVFPRSSEV